MDAGGNPDGGATCTEDSDCAIGFDQNVCCPACTGAYLASDVESDRCITRFGSAPAPDICRPEACPPKPCPDVDCALATRAVCEGGTCELRGDCPAGTALQYGECWPSCTTHADCGAATNQAVCCPACREAFPAALIDERECIVPPGETVPIACGALACPDIPCPPVSCVAGRAVCLDSGECSWGPETGCPDGYAESGGCCVASDSGG